MAIKERPIIMADESVLAILAGRKTQTRRVIKPQPPEDIDALHGHQFRNRAPYSLEHYETGTPSGFGFDYNEDGDQARFPYGQPEDRLWVREVCRAEELPDGRDGVRYRADGDWVLIGNTQKYADLWGLMHWHCINLPSRPEAVGRWVSPLFMPCWASRLTLEITGVQVERVQEIGYDDVVAEGVWQMDWATDQPHPNWKQEWIRRWDQLNAKRGYGWDTNPWVWVIEFKRVATGGE